MACTRRCENDNQIPYAMYLEWSVYFRIINISRQPFISIVSNE